MTPATSFDRQDAAYHPHLRAWALVDLAEAAAADGGYQDAARCQREPCQRRESPGYGDDR